MQTVTSRAGRESLALLERAHQDLSNNTKMKVVAQGTKWVQTVISQVGRESFLALLERAHQDLSNDTKMKAVAQKLKAGHGQKTL